MNARVLASVAALALLLSASVLPAPVFAQSRTDRSTTLRVATVNVWTGLDYIGTVRMGEWESEQRRERRLSVLIEQLRAADLDVVLLQEASPVSSISSRIAEALDFDEIHQVANAGIKLGPLGIPSNLSDGIAILAKRTLRLEEAHTWKLSGSPGLHGDVMSMHFDEAVFALAGVIHVGDLRMYIVNAHLSATPIVDDALVAELERRVARGEIAREEVNAGLELVRERYARRVEEVRTLGEHLGELDPRVPVILGGDFNTTIESGELAPITDSLGYLNALPPRLRMRPTWDPSSNPNVAYSTRLVDASGRRHDADAIVAAVYDERARTIDHLFTSPQFLESATVDGGILADGFAEWRDADGVVDSIKASDHYGIVASLDLTAIATSALRSSDSAIDVTQSSIDALPIATYDSDAGFGYGVKGYLLNQLGGGESLDLTLFNSTAGERWYRIVASWPDAGLRHRRVYPIAFDLELDYDKWVHNSYFGVGGESRFEDRRFYARAPLEASLSASSGLSRDVVVGLSARFKTVLNTDMQDSARWSALGDDGVPGRASWTSVAAALRIDTRNSSVNATRGAVLHARAEIAVPIVDDVEFVRLGSALQWYATLWYPTTVLALRLSLDGIVAPHVPVHALLSLGGNNTLRGSPQDRYLDRVMAVANAELRFPIIGRFGAVAGYDAGRVWHDIAEVGLADWAVNPVLGLRFNMDTFVVRLDVGFGRETTGLYFNFGQIF